MRIYYTRGFPAGQVCAYENSGLGYELQDGRRPPCPALATRRKPHPERASGADTAGKKPRNAPPTRRSRPAAGRRSAQFVLRSAASKREGAKGTAKEPTANSLFAWGKRLGSAWAGQQKLQKQYRFTPVNGSGVKGCPAAIPVKNIF